MVYQKVDLKDGLRVDRKENHWAATKVVRWVHNSADC